MDNLYSESDKYKPHGVDDISRPAPQDIEGVEEKLFEFVKSHSTQKDPVSVYMAIDDFCRKHWMMNLGPEKGVIIRDQFEGIKPKTILEVGTYCGYSSIYFSSLTSPDTKIYTLETNEKTRVVAHKMFEWAGVLDKVTQLKGNVQQNIEAIKKIGHIDVIFLDHWKNVYLSDLHILQKQGVVSKGTVVIADNVICPGVPDYLAYMKSSPKYQSVLYHSQLQYSPQIPDAVLVSRFL